MIEDIVIGDSLEFECDAGEDITGWQIKCEIWDQWNSMRKATANSGGSDSQIKITDASNGLFSIFINKGETSIYSYMDVVFIEIEVQLPNSKIYTVKQDKIKFSKQRIDW